MGDTVKQFPKEKDVQFPVYDELISRIKDTIYEYPELSNVSVLGILEVVKQEFLD